MLQTYIQPLINYLHLHPHLSGVITFFIAFIESVAVLGTIVPGSVTMTAIGALIGTGILPFGNTLLLATLGALTGDLLSYWFGIHFKERISTIWPFTKYKNLIPMGETFFARHGGKSVIIGRFVGPMRSLVPLIAGILNMPLLRFLLATTLSAICWAFVYMGPGILLGALAMELPPKIATQFLIYVLLIILIIWFATALIHLFFKKIWQQIDARILKLWQWLKDHPSMSWVYHIVKSPSIPDCHQQLTLTILSLIFGFLFIFIFYSVAKHGIITHFNEPIFHLLSSLRNKPTDNVMIAFTLLSDKKVMLSAAGLILLGLVIYRYWWAALHWCVLTLLAAGSIDVFKKIFYYPRPGQLLNNQVTSSFPSGHTTLGLSLLGFLALLIASQINDEDEKYIPHFVAIIIVFFIALSRLYLGAHWLSDILGSLALASTLILLTTISYRRKLSAPISAVKLSIGAIIIFIACWSIYGAKHFRQMQYDYTPLQITQTISKDSWWHHKENYIPLYRRNRFGNPIAALNVQWIGSLEKIKNNLLVVGWTNQEPTMNLQTTLHRLSSKEIEKHLPILPELYNNSAPVLLMTKVIGTDQQIIILRLWHSNVKIGSTNEPFWLGSVTYQLTPHQLSAFKKGLTSISLGATDTLKNDLKLFQWKEFIIPENQQPLETQHLRWDGKLLLIK